MASKGKYGAQDFLADVREFIFTPEANDSNTEALMKSELSGALFGQVESDTARAYQEARASGMNPLRAATIRTITSPLRLIGESLRGSARSIREAREGAHLLAGGPRGEHGEWTPEQLKVGQAAFESAGLADIGSMPGGGTGAANIVKKVAVKDVAKQGKEWLRMLGLQKKFVDAKVKSGESGLEDILLSKEIEDQIDQIKKNLPIVTRTIRRGIDQKILDPVKKVQLMENSRALGTFKPGTMEAAFSVSPGSKVREETVFHEFLHSAQVATHNKLAQQRLNEGKPLGILANYPKGFFEAQAYEFGPRAEKAFLAKGKEGRIGPNEFVSLAREAQEAAQKQFRNKAYDIDLDDVLEYYRGVVRGKAGQIPGEIRFKEDKPQVDYSRQAQELGIKFNGVQELGKGRPGVPLFTDSETKSTFSIQTSEDLPTKLRGVREMFRKASKTSISDDTLDELNVWHGGRKLEGEKFKEEFIGSGAGNAAGWGLYASEARGVAEHYAETLAKNESRISGWNIGDMFYNSEELPPGVARHLGFYGDGNEVLGRLNLLDNIKVAKINQQDMQDALRSFDERLNKRNMAYFGEQTGYDIAVDRERWVRSAHAAEKRVADLTQLMDFLYSKDQKIEPVYSSVANLYKLKAFEGMEPKEHPFLAWDKPLVGQSPEAANKLRELYGTLLDKDIITKEAMRDLFDLGHRGSDMYQHLERQGMKGREAAKTFYSSGIKGVELPVGYFSGASEKEKNYVFFNPEEDLRIQDIYPIGK